MEDAQGEEFKHFGMDLEFLLRRTPKWRAALEAFLHGRATSSPRCDKGEEAEEAAWRMKPRGR